MVIIILIMGFCIFSGLDIGEQRVAALRVSSLIAQLSPCGLSPVMLGCNLSF